MKKLSSALLVVALSVAMVLPVFAAPSPQATAKAAKANATVVVAGAEVKELPAANLDEYVEQIAESASVLKDLGVSTAAKFAAAFDLKIEIPAGQTSVSVPIKVNNAKVGDYAVILHRRADGQWEKVGEGFHGADMTVTGTFTNFSPVMVMVVDAAAAKAGVKAPKTGEF